MNRNRHAIFFVLCAAVLSLLCASSFAQDAPAPDPELDTQAWLRYARLDSRAQKAYEHLPNKVVARGDSVLLRSAQQELIRGVDHMLGRTLTSTDPAGMASGGNFIALTPLRSMQAPPEL